MILPNPFLSDPAAFVADAAVIATQPPLLAAALNSNLPPAHFAVRATLAGAEVGRLKRTDSRFGIGHFLFMRAISEELADELRTINEAILLRQFGERT